MEVVSVSVNAHAGETIGEIHLVRESIGEVVKTSVEIGAAPYRTCRKGEDERWKRQILR